MQYVDLRYCILSNTIKLKQAIVSIKRYQQLTAVMRENAVKPIVVWCVPNCS